jgi:hypothetical protein
MIVVRVLILAVLAAFAAAPLCAQNSRSTDDAAVKRAKACNAAAAGKNLSDTQYRAYLKACLASTRPPAELFESIRTIERRCNTIANDRQLTAQDRVAFMQSCRNKGG